MSEPGLLANTRAWYVTARQRAALFPLSLLQLAMRIAIGMVFFSSARLKVNSFEFAVRLFRDEYRLPVKLFPEEYNLPTIDPVLAAQVATFMEVAIPLFLFAGLATRLATVPLLVMTAVIQLLVFPNAWPVHLMWAAMLVFVLSRGPGFFSIDHVIERAIQGTVPWAKAWPYAVVVGSLSLTAWLTVATFPQVVPSPDMVPVVQWSLLALTVAMLVVAYITGPRDDKPTAESR